MQKVLLNVMFFGSLIIGAMGILLATLISRGMMANISNLLSATELIYKGDFTKKIEIRSHDEIGMLAASFNTMTEKLNDIVISRDKEIEKRKTADERVNKKADEQKLLLNNIETQIWYLTDTENYGSVNKAHAEFLGMNKEDLENRSIYDIFNETEAEVSIAGNKEVFIDKKKIRTEEWVGNSKAEKRLLSITKAPKLDKKGNVQYVICAGEDITERRQMEEALNRSYDQLEQKVAERTVEIFRTNALLKKEVEERRQANIALKKSEQNYRLLAENVTDIIWTIDINTLQYTYLSPSIERNQGFTPEEMMDSSFKRVLTPASAELAENLLTEELAKEEDGTVDPTKVYTLELELYCKDESTIWADVKTSFLRDKQGKVTGILGVSRNINDRKLAEEEKKKLEIQLHHTQKIESIGTLAGGIAHDFNNLLFPIIGYSEMLLEDVANNHNAKMCVEEILVATNRAKHLVQQILAFSRHSGKDYRPLRIQFVIKEALKLIRASIPTTIEIITNLDDNCRDVMGEATEIHQVLMNLCTNAYQAMPESGGKLEIQLTEVVLGLDAIPNYPNLSPGGYARISVSDNGIGIKQNIQERIFDPFFTTKEPGKGTGMGLAVSHGIIKNHDGAIRFDSEQGKGTTFHLHLPVIETISDNIEIESSPNPIVGGDERILIVDDEDQIVAMEQEMLERLGYQVTARTSSVEALEAFRSQPDHFDLVISDMTMPNMSGDQLAKNIMAIRPDTPVILCTGFSERMDDDRSKSLGIRAFVMKPILKNHLANTIRNVIDEIES